MGSVRLAVGQSAGHVRSSSPAWQWKPKPGCVAGAPAQAASRGRPPRQACAGRRRPAQHSPARGPRIAAAETSYMQSALSPAARPWRAGRRARLEQPRRAPRRRGAGAACCAWCAPGEFNLLQFAACCQCLAVSFVAGCPDRRFVGEHEATDRQRLAGTGTQRCIKEHIDYFINCLSVAHIVGSVALRRAIRASAASAPLAVSRLNTLPCHVSPCHTTVLALIRATVTQDQPLAPTRSEGLVQHAASTRALTGTQQVVS